MVLVEGTLQNPVDSAPAEADGELKVANLVRHHIQQQMCKHIRVLCRHFEMVPSRVLKPSAW